MRYRVAWRSMWTGECGSGEWLDSYDLAAAWVAYANTGRLYYWIESEPSPAELASETLA